MGGACFEEVCRSKLVCHVVLVTIWNKSRRSPYFCVNCSIFRLLIAKWHTPFRPSPVHLWVGNAQCITGFQNPGGAAMHDSCQACESTPQQRLLQNPTETALMLYCPVGRRNGAIKSQIWASFTHLGLVLLLKSVTATIWDMFCYKWLLHIFVESLPSYRQDNRAAICSALVQR
jgi:hypothetical protein